MNDIIVEKLFEEFTRIPWNKEDKNNYKINVPFIGFPKGTEQKVILDWFDKHHSKGIYWLINEYEPGEHFTRTENVETGYNLCPLFKKGCKREKCKWWDDGCYWEDVFFRNT